MLHIWWSNQTMVFGNVPWNFSIHTFLWKRFGIYLKKIINILNIAAGSMMLGTPHEQKLVRYHSLPDFPWGWSSQKRTREESSCTLAILFFTGDYWITHFGGIKQCNLYGRFGGFTSTGAVFGLVICPCFTTWNTSGKPTNVPWKLMVGR